MRRLTLKDGASDKFWEIDLQGNQYTVRYGRAGTDGQLKTKEFDSEAKAKSEHDKQIAAKLKKGYVEDSAATGSLPAQAVTEPPKAKTSSQKKTTSEASATTPTATETKPIAAYAEEPVSLGLLPVDWRWAPWRPREETEIPPPRPFNLEQLQKTFSGIRIDKSSYLGDFDWRTAETPLRMSKEEAAFWLVAMSNNRRTIAERKKHLKEWDFSKPVDYKQMLYNEAPSTPWLMIPAFNLLSEQEFLDLALTEKEARYHGADLQWERVRGLQYVLPLLSAPGIERLKDAARAHVSVANWPVSNFYQTTNYFVLAAVLGLSDLLTDVVESWDDKLYSGDAWHDHYHKPQEVIFGLQDPEQVSRHFRRLKLRLSNPDYIRAWLAHTGLQHLDYIEESLKQESNRDQAENQLSALIAVNAAEVAPVMLSLTKASKAPKMAKNWLDEHPQAAVTGLAHCIASHRSGALRQDALAALRLMKRKGYADLMQQTAAHQPTLAETIDEVLNYEDPADNPLTDAETPDWLQTGLTPKSKAKPVDWIDANDLPPIIMAGRAFNAQHVAALLLTLKTADSQQAPFFQQLKEQTDGGCLDAFAWALFEAWLSEGAPSKEKWAMMAMGYLGGDESVMKLTPLIRKWPGESQHQRAVSGLEVLRLIGSKTALMQLSGISQKVKFKGVKSKAQEYMEQIAAEKGLTKAELEDMVIPDCGLDEKGRRVFDYGPRQFHFVLGSDLKPKLKDDSGKLRDNPPKPSAKDDAELANDSLQEWKLVKKQIRDMAKIQAERLEQAMVVGRRWKAEDFDALIARHPLMTHLARLLLWGGYQNGQLAGTFRLTDEQDFADVNDDPLALDGFDEVGLVHPLHLTEEDKNAWGEMFSDYELLPPFQQLSRPVFALSEEELEQQSMSRFEKMKLPAPTLVFGLEKQGWARGEAMDAGGFDEHSKQFAAANVTAVVNYEGVVGMGYIEADETLETTEIVFVKGMRQPSGYGWDQKDKILPLKQVDPLVISEVIKDLNQLAAKAEQ
ncbi:uncharacterized conserved protein [Hahella chejuensis KCTC 2396]|uniref:Uncharacterized conserved protein n=1 Tax=Hahella chejuensis (strain KCTC 2396) TaxID=349521 RepID=Q2SH02_HAHCH|nr:DUF4132 domain-containing protein [Hahella chejuensis]ABC30072.1 uncharacterized conserved protein [Hahella chejuensis KCTC 2396]